ncbi:amidohydrolase family protein [Adhaeribacter sp. BT258]|uniref:Amidohydrolase family protein n=1 Tax=Adhaeribacter terrigena TaxID=2793070 RepID=A0ABS1C012_9BACT|nr:amidohydrolase family protein [Adhaeribacter terrigena]MBK0402690.1 amidohydrolase family protein [Adhaeribacter terrigena]
MKKKFFNAKLYRNPSASEIVVEDGKITEVGTNLAKCEKEIDLNGKLVLPPYVDSHLHLDYVYTGRNDGGKIKTGTLFEGITRWHDIKKTQTKEDARERALAAIREEVSQGVQFIRTHIDVTDPRLLGMKVMLELREELKDTVTIQIVSFPQEGMFAYKGGYELVEEALKMGADCVGGIPHFEWAREIGERSVHSSVELAMKYGKMIDVHCDETDDVMARFVELLNALTMTEGVGLRTAASHTCSFGSADDAYAYRMMGLFKANGMNFIACPTENAYLQGRQDTYPKRRGLTRVREFLREGINVCFGQDSINDPWYPLGNGNLMNILDNGIHLTQVASYEELETAFDLITYNGAKTMMLEDQYGLEKGKPANFIVLNESSAFEAIRKRAEVLASVRKGEFLFRRKETEYEIPLNL